MPQDRHQKYERLIARCKSLPPTSCAVACPCGESSLRGAFEAGQPGILVVPDLEAGNMLAKSLSFVADAAGVVLGARVPVILTSRADSVPTRLASCAVAVLVAQARCQSLSKAVA